METTWKINPKALATWNTCDLVAFFMGATETMILCDDGHEMTLEAAHGRCPFINEDDEDEDEDW